MKDRISESKILVTGGAGFIGKHLVNALSKLQCQIIVYDNLSQQIHGDDAEFDKIDGVDYIKGDIRDKVSLSKAVNDVDIIFHLVSETGTGQSMYDIEQYVSVNDLGTSILIELASEIKGKEVHLILSSSRSIYGEGLYLNSKGKVCQPSSRPKFQLDSGDWGMYDENGESLIPIPTYENCQPSPQSIYAATKYSQEMLLSVSANAISHLKCSILRFQNVYGVGQSLRNPYTGIISIFYNRIRQGLPILIFEDGLESRDFIYVKDVVDSLLAAAARSTDKTIVVNVGSGVQTSVSDLAAKLIEVSGFNGKCNITGQFRIGDIRHCYADLSNAKLELNFEPKVNLKQGLSLFCEWASKEPAYIDESESAQKLLQDKGLA